MFVYKRNVQKLEAISNIAYRIIQNKSEIITRDSCFYEVIRINPAAPRTAADGTSKWQLSIEETEDN